MSQSQQGTLVPPASENEQSRFGVNVKTFGIRPDVGNSGDDVYIDNWEYEKPDAKFEYVGGERVDNPEGYFNEKSVVAIADDGYIAMAIPLVDLAKYLLQHEPDILERARKELGAA